MHVVIVDLGVGNLRSVEHAVRAVASDAHIEISSQPAVVDRADKVMLPGQGAIGTWLHQLDDRALLPSLNKARSEKPLLGICVGMQALFETCEEDGGHAGLGWYPGSVRHFSSSHQDALKIPQMGWNTVAQQGDHALWQGIEDNAYFYFVHSYYAQTPDQNMVAATANYGGNFVAAVASGNVFATQFHPEKSHQDGLTLLRNFIHWDGAD